MESTISERLTLIIDYLKISDVEFARKLDVTKQEVNRWKNGVKIPLIIIGKIFELWPEINGNWFITGTGLMITESELKRMILFYDKNRYSATYHRTLRHFLFMCLTGLRISDFLRLKKENLFDESLKFVPYKTRAKKPIQIIVPLIAKAKQLITDENCKTDFLFETISEQKYNLQYKDIFPMAGIYKSITNHSARHTFATQFIEKTSDVATLQKILGHTDIKDTMVYVHISTKKITDQMSNFGRLIENMINLDNKKVIQGLPSNYN